MKERVCLLVCEAAKGTRRAAIRAHRKVTDCIMARERRAGTAEGQGRRKCVKKVGKGTSDEMKEYLDSGECK